MRIFIRSMFVFFMLMQVPVSNAEPLTIAVNAFSPPYVTMTSNQVFHGFDIEMMQHLCKTLDRECRFRAVPFDRLIDVVAEGEYELALSGLTITTERAERVNFTMPYLPSTCSYLGKTKLKNAQVDLPFLEKQRFGVEQGTIFEAIIRGQGIIDAPVKTYRDAHALIEALHYDNVSLILLDRPSALYWRNQSREQFSVIGRPFPCGAGTAIAVNPENTELLKALNQALARYHRSNLREKHKRYYVVGEISGP